MSLQELKSNCCKARMRVFAELHVGETEMDKSFREYRELVTMYVLVELLDIADRGELEDVRRVVEAYAEKNNIKLK